MLRIYNTLTRKIEEFKPINPSKVGLYSCGPTVYDYQHIGHMKKYIGDDMLVGVLKANGYKVKHVMNITDVGHLVSDEDSGEDKMEKGAKKYGMSVWDIAKKFEKQFLDSTDAVGIQRPSELMHATDYIKEQIALIQMLEKKGYTYEIPKDGMYYDTSKFPTYFNLSHQNPEELKKGARVEFVKGKRNIADFALWKFSPSASSGQVQKRQMEWDSPWGIGFPGWHIECSAMSLKALTDFFDGTPASSEHSRTIDIHTGGIDHIAIHHTNEIAQSEGATGEKFVNFWVHHNFLVVNNEKMSKSLGNFYTVQDVIERGYDPLALRYLILQTHYRQEMNFTWESLDAAAVALRKLRSEVSTWKEAKIGCAEYEARFMEALNDDLNSAKALAVMWELVKSDYPTDAKAESLKKFDAILGLQLFKKETEKKSAPIPDEVKVLLAKRDALRKAGDWSAADKIREKITELGFTVTDTNKGTSVTK